MFQTRYFGALSTHCKVFFIPVTADRPLLVTIRDDVLKHIKNTYLKQLDVPIGSPKPCGARRAARATKRRRGVSEISRWRPTFCHENSIHEPAGTNGGFEAAIASDNPRSLRT